MDSTRECAWTTSLVHNDKFNYNVIWPIGAAKFGIGENILHCKLMPVFLGSIRVDESENVRISFFVQKIGLMDFVSLRQYLAAPARQTPAELALDAFATQDPGAVQLVRFVLELRVNPRSRRNFEEVQNGYRMSPQPRWFTLLMTTIWNFYRVSLAHGSVRFGDRT